MNYYVYVLKSKKDKKRYVGMSKDPYKRVKDHNSGHVKSTKGRGPFEISYKEECKSREIARQKEKYFKSGSGRELLDKIIPR